MAYKIEYKEAQHTKGYLQWLIGAEWRNLTLAYPHIKGVLEQYGAVTVTQDEDEPNEVILRLVPHTNTHRTMALLKASSLL